MTNKKMNKLQPIKSYPNAACTGISMIAQDGTKVLARTIDWGGTEVDNYYTIVPRGYEQQSLLPDGKLEGIKFSSKYGYVGMAMGEVQFVVEGVNEVGLSSGLFYFPDYGEYPIYDDARKENTIADLQLVSYLLSHYSSVDEAIAGIKQLDIISVFPGASTVHWRIADKTGRQIVVEHVKGVAQFYENHIGVITNSPGFEWHIVNLSNYIHVNVGTIPSRNLGQQFVESIGSGSGYLGLPGDFTPPSRFVRAAYFLNTTRQQPDGIHTVLQLFHLLNVFDVPLACDTPVGKEPLNFPSATQWTVATNLTDGLMYYRTMYNSNIRCIDLHDIDFATISFIAKPLDVNKEQPIEKILINV